MIAPLTHIRTWTVAAVVVAAMLELPIASGGAAAVRGSTASQTVWLCRPGQADDPCSYSSAATAVSSSGATSSVAAGGSASSSKFDCFYVYPTVSTN